MADIEIIAFQPETYSDQQKERLDSLLDQLSKAASERKAYLNRGRLAALNAWLKSPEGAKTGHDYQEIFNAVPNERFPAYMEEIITSNFPEQADDLLEKLEEFSITMQKQAIGYTASFYADFIDRKEDRAHWAKIDELYETILKENPGILTNLDDIKGAIKLGNAIQNHKGELTRLWKNSAMPQQIEAAKTLLAEAYPNDEIEKLHISEVKTKTAIAAYLTSLNADTMVCGPLFSGGKSKSYDFGLYLLSHEFQHRRQSRLAKRFENGELKKGSAEYYQGQLYHANFEGGYLSMVTAVNKLARIARYTDYCEQPVERQANDIAKLSSTFGKTSGAALYALSEGLGKAFSTMARPVNTVAYNIERAVTALTGGGKPQPGA